AKADWFAGFYRSLTENGTAFLLSDTALDPARWRRFKIIVVSSFEYMNGALQRDLVDFAQEGGVVAIGPQIPHLGDTMEEDDTIQSALRRAAGQPLGDAGTELGTAWRLGKGRLVHLTALAGMAEALKASMAGVNVVSFCRNDPRLDVTIHRSVTDPGRVIAFVANPTADTIPAQVTFDFDMKSVREIWDNRDVPISGRHVNEQMKPYTVKIYECTL